MAALSTYMWLSSTWGYSCATSFTTSRHRMLVSSTLALSTEQSLRPRFIAVSKPTRAMRRISDSV